MNPAGVLARLERCGVVMVSRSDSTDSARHAIEVARDSGICAIEVTFSVPGAVELIDELARSGDPELLIGAGSVLTRAHARAAIDAGASFLASPGLDAEVLDLTVDAEVLMMPGVLTPSEAMRATALGALAVKLFPASTVGPGFVAALHAPLPGLKVIASGGIDSETAASWLRAGAIAVAVGGALSPRGSADKKILNGVREEALAVLTAVRSSKANQEH